jgi:hypothetical protein
MSEEQEPSTISTISTSTSSANGKRKRQRVSLACERCRAKKYRCDGAGPPCAACHTADTICIYGQSGQRRGLKTGYVKVLEMLWGLVLKEVPNSEQVATRLLATLSREDLDNNSPEALQAWRESGLHSSIASLLDHGPLEHINRKSARCPPHALPWSLESAAATADLPQSAPALPQGAPVLSQSASADNRVQIPISEASILPVDTRTVLPSIKEPTASPALPSEWHLLLQAYLSYEESWLPILPKSVIWRIAFAYKASGETAFNVDRNARGDAASLWAALMLGEMHVNGAMSAGMQALQTRAYALLTPTFSSEPDASYAPAFLMWSIVHMGRRDFTLAKMKLVQAQVLAVSQPPPIPSTDGKSLLTNTCFVMDVLLALATNCKPLDIGSDSPAKEVREGELTDWEPFIDPLRQQQNASITMSSLQSRPSRTYNTYAQFLKLCTLLHAVTQGNDLQGDSEVNFNNWSACLPSHLKFDNPSSSTVQDPRLPSEVNFQIFSLMCRSRITTSQTGTLTRDAPLTCDKPTGTELLRTLSLQQQWDVRRLPLSFGVVIHLLSVDTTYHPADPSSELNLPSLRKLIADFATQYGWRSAENDLQSTSVPITDNRPLPGLLTLQATTQWINPVSTTQQVVGTGSDPHAAQQCTDNVETLRAIRGNHPDGNRPDFGPMINGDIPDPMIPDLDDSLFPGAYLDLFDEDERYTHTGYRDRESPQTH